MKDVFISYSRRDKEFVRRLSDALKAHDRDPWIDWEDISPGVDWQQEIRLGIENANTFLFVMSPDAIVSRQCIVELEQAIALNKRLLPILLREFDYSDVHPALSSINWLFFRDVDDFDSAFASLLNVLDTDLEHVRQHTRLLVRAIEWERKSRDESFLLRGSDLSEATQWLEKSTRKKPPPTELQREYIHASHQLEEKRREIESRTIPFLAKGSLRLLSLAAQPNRSTWKNLVWLANLERERLEFLLQRVDVDVPMAYLRNAQDAFISYSRKDGKFAQKLHRALRQKDCHAWADWSNIPPGADWRLEIDRGIEQADNFIFVVSPHSIRSNVCHEEIDHAAKHNKRIIPIIYREIPPRLQHKIHPELGRFNWIHFAKKGRTVKFEKAFQDLLATIQTDPEYTRRHTDFLVRARTWQKSKRDDDLLRGESLIEAEQWLLEGDKQNQPPSDLHKEYIRRSREYEANRPQIEQEMRERLTPN